MSYADRVNRLRRVYSAKEPFNVWKAAQPNQAHLPLLDVWDGGWQHGGRHFAQWLLAVEKVLVEKYRFKRPVALDASAWVEYWVDGTSPEEAVAEDMSYV